MTREPFLFRDHLDLAEVARVERMREHYIDAHILTYHERLRLLIDPERLAQFMRRNPRRTSEAA